MTKLTAIYIISILLLCFNPIDRKLGHYSPRKMILPLFQKSLIASFKDRRLARLVIAYTIGEKQYLSRKIKESHTKLNLLHLFTPSGIHISSLYFLITPLLMWIRRRSKKGYILTISSLCLAMFLLPKFYSIKRVTLLRQLTLMLGRFKHIFTPFNLFLLTFGIDFLIGTYRSSPLSFCYSFLFLGVIICNIEELGPKLIFSLLGAQIIVAYFQMSSLTLIGFLFGFMLTGLFSTLFPVIFLLFWIHPLIGTGLLEYVVKIYASLVSSFANIATYSGSYSPSLILIVVAITITLKIRRHYKILVLMIGVFTHSDPLYNLPTRDGVKVGSSDFRKEKVVTIKRVKRGYKIVYRDGVTCYAKLYNGFYNERCR